MSYAPDVREIRARFGLSQQELANWLGISRSQYSQVETGSDPLPAHARPWLWAWRPVLALPLPEPPTPVAPLPGVGEPAGPAAVRTRIAECQYQAQRLAAPLAALATQQARNRATLAAAPVLAAALARFATVSAPPAPSDVGRRVRWLARWQEAATDALQPEAAKGPTAALLLAARQAAWLHEAAWLTASLTQSPAP